jgi:hypothetical protein
MVVSTISSDMAAVASRAMVMAAAVVSATTTASRRSVNRHRHGRARNRCGEYDKISALHGTAPDF